MTEPQWISIATTNTIHEHQIRQHGGGSGVRDEGLFESALARPINAFSYGEGDLCALAASYAYGIARNHPFVDGNKRTAFVVSALFLQVNGLQLIADEATATHAVLMLAAGDFTEAEFAQWLRDNTQSRSQ